MLIPRITTVRGAGAFVALALKPQEASGDGQKDAIAQGAVMEGVWGKEREKWRGAESVLSELFRREIKHKLPLYQMQKKTAISHH